MALSEVYEFEIPGHTTRREWAVYVIIGTSSLNGNKMLYVGKVGDNREGCNPIISRIGNHLSHNSIHSQWRNKVPETTGYNYRIVYSVFGLYDEEKHTEDRLRINEIERQLNLLIQSKISNGLELLNPYKGVGISKKLFSDRLKLITRDELDKIENLASRAVS